MAFDGRFRTCYPQEIVDMHFDLILGEVEPDKRFRGPQSGPADPVRVLQYGRPDLVLINRFQPHSEQVMRSQQDQWVLLYQDRIAQLWGRRSTYDDPRLASYIGLSRRSISDEPQRGSVRWPALPERSLDTAALATAPAEPNRSRIPGRDAAHRRQAETASTTAPLRLAAGVTSLLDQSLRALAHSLRGN